MEEILNYRVQIGIRSLGLDLFFVENLEIFVFVQKENFGQRFGWWVGVQGKFLVVLGDCRVLQR